MGSVRWVRCPCLGNEEEGRVVVRVEPVEHVVLAVHMEAAEEVKVSSHEVVVPPALRVLGRRLGRVNRRAEVSVH
jgi:hypothetical protein